MRFIGRVLVAAALWLAPSLAIAQCSGTFAPGEVCGNPSASGSLAGRAGQSPLIDRAFSSTRGSILYRGAAAWAALPPGTTDFVFTSNGAGADPSYRGFIQDGAGAVTRTPQDKARDFVDVKDFGAVPGSPAAAGLNTLAVNAALVKGKEVRCTSLYYVTGITLPLDNTSLICDSKFASGFVGTVANAPTITVGAGLNVRIANMSVMHNVTATAGGDGIWFAGHSPVSSLENLSLSGNHIGLNLRSASYSLISNVYSWANVSHGIQMMPSGIANTFQWQIDGVLTENNGGNGIFVTTGGGIAAHASMGDWDRVSTFNNGGAGIYFAGEATKKIESVRITNGFFGDDVAGAIVFDNTYGTQHVISNSYFELSASALNISANNNNVIVSNCIIGGMTNAGIVWSNTGGSLTVNGGMFVSNVSGILAVATGTFTLNGSRYITNTTAINIGAFAVDGTVMGNSFASNGADFTSASTLPIIFRGNTGINDRYPTGTGIADAAGNEILLFVQTALAVNEFRMTNAAAGGYPTLSATGNDTNIGMLFQVKGVGYYGFLGTSTGPAVLKLFEDTDNGVNSISLSVPSSIVSDIALLLPVDSGTLITQATLKTLTNTTFDTAGSGNSFSINGLAATANTGTGAVVRATSPALVTPALGTPASGVMTNVTGLPLTTGVTGTLSSANGGWGTATMAWTAWTPTLTCNTGSATTTRGGRYLQVGKTMLVQYSIGVSAVAACTMPVTLNFPIVATAAAQFTLVGVDTGLSLIGVAGSIAAGGNTFSLNKMDGTLNNPIAAGAGFSLSGVIEIQ